MPDSGAIPSTAKHAQPRRPGEVRVPKWPSRWVGWLLFAGVMMIVLGMLHAFQGFVALFEEEFYLVGKRGLAIHVDYRVWGWIHLFLGLIVIAAGIGLLNGRLWARIVTVVLAVVSTLVSAAFLSAYPIWSTIMIAVDILVIWAVTVHGDEMRTMRETAQR
ncbi:MAG TPA: hypothetical protein VFI00_20170 [Kribbella sp.]|nr:hypothetical protein [Kribbella sp.]